MALNCCGLASIYPEVLVSNFWYQVGKVKGCCNFVWKSQACSELYAAVCIFMLYLRFADLIAREEQHTQMPGERLFAFDMAQLTSFLLPFQTSFVGEGNLEFNLALNFGPSCAFH